MKSVPFEGTEDGSIKTALFAPQRQQQHEGRSSCCGRAQGSPPMRGTIAHARAYSSVASFPAVLAYITGLHLRHCYH